MNLFGNYVNLFVGHDTREPLIYSLSRVFFV
jgi:hypothetical protein